MPAPMPRPSPPPDRDSPEPGRDAPPSAAEVGELFRDHNQTLVRFLSSRLCSEQEAKEVAQEAYVRLLQLERRGTVSFMRAYLFRIAANLAIDRIRQRRSQGPHEDIELFEELEDGAAPERTVMATEELERIVRIVEELPERCAQAFALHRFHGMRPSEVAKAMSISDRMVRNHLVRGLLYFRLRMDNHSAAEALEKTKESPKE